MIFIHDCLFHISGAKNFYFIDGYPYIGNAGQRTDCTNIKTARVMKSFLSLNEKSLNASDFVSLTLLKERYEEWNNDSSKEQTDAIELIDYIKKIIPMISDRSSGISVGTVCYKTPYYPARPGVSIIKGMKPGLQPPTIPLPPKLPVPQTLTFSFTKPAPTEITVKNVLKRFSFAYIVNDKEVLADCKTFIKKYFSNLNYEPRDNDKLYHKLRIKNKEESHDYINGIDLEALIELVTKLKSNGIKVSLLPEGRVVLSIFEFPTLKKFKILEDLDKLIYFEVAADREAAFPCTLLDSGRFKRLYAINIV